MIVIFVYSSSTLYANKVPHPKHYPYGSLRAQATVQRNANMLHVRTVHSLSVNDSERM